VSTDPTTTIVGNLTADPELRYGASGTAWATFTVAHTPRVYDKASAGYRDGDPLFLRCKAFRDLAENAAQSLSRGVRVVVTGKLQQSTWETQTGEKRSSIDLLVDEIGPSLRFATAAIAKVRRTGGSAARAAEGDDPWASTELAAAPQASPATDYDNDPPF
jgi:single-strand DNA-binding protein